MPSNTHNNISYERISIHEGIKSFHLLSRLKELDTTEVIDIIAHEGKSWYIEIAFKDNKKLLISNSLPSHFKHQVGVEPKLDNELYFGIISNHE